MIDDTGIGVAHAGRSAALVSSTRFSGSTAFIPTARSNIRPSLQTPGPRSTHFTRPHSKLAEPTTARRVFVIPPKVTRGVTTPPSYSIPTAIIMSMSAIGVTADKGRLFLGTHAAKRCLGKLGGYLGYLGFARRIFGDDATDFLNWQWSADEEALNLGAAEHTHLRELVGGLDAFGRCNHA